MAWNQRKQTNDTESNARVPVFLPTHYTARVLTFHNGYGDTYTTPTDEAVMVVETARYSNRVRVLRGDAAYAWVDPEDIYTGPRRS